MTTLPYFLLVALTSLCAYAAERSRKAKGQAARPAIETLLECVGMSVVFICCNVVTCALIILLVRRVTTQFVPLGAAADLRIVLLSTIQGFVFHLWRRTAVS